MDVRVEIFAFNLKFRCHSYVKDAAKKGANVHQKEQLI